MDSIFLMGMPYSGKTTLGKKLARELNCGFVDLDSEIEDSTGHSIPEIFEKDGEKVFRDIETRILNQVISNITSPIIISLGGGTPCYNENMDLIKSSGVSIFLDVSLPEIIKRSESDQSRPLLKGDNRIAVVERLFNERRSCYLKADTVVSGRQISVSEIKKLIKS